MIRRFRFQRLASSIAPIALAMLSIQAVFAAAPYSEDWSGGANSWFISSTKGSASYESDGGNPGGYMRYTAASNSFDNKGITSTAEANALGDYGAAGIAEISFDARPSGVFDTVSFRFRPETGGNGWDFHFPGDEAPVGTWTTFTIPIDASWDDAMATSNGWTQMSSTTATFSETIASVKQIYLQGYKSVDIPGETIDFDNFSLSEATVQYPGNANGDMFVDRRDLTIVAMNFGVADAGFEQGDFDGSGDVNLGDLSILQRHFGETAVASPEAAAAAVPEPSTLALAAVASIVGFSVNRRRRRIAR